MLKLAHRQRGFSVIELMVALVILALLFTFGMPQYYLWLQNGRVRSAAEGLASALQFARTEAVSRNVAGGVTFQLRADDWRVYPTNETTDILRTQTRPDGASVAVSVGGTAQTGDVTLTFDSFGRLNAVNGTAPGTALTTVAVTKAGDTCVAAGGDIRCLSVTVTPSGGIRMCDPARPSGDPQRC